MTFPIEPFVFLLVSFMLYSRALFGPFMFDDRDGLLQNKYIQEKDFKSPLYMSPWRGLTVASWALNQCAVALEFSCPSCGKGGRAVRPWSFRAVNVILHALNAVQVTYIASFHVEHPWLAGLLFAVGPFSVYSVSYITARGPILSTLFALSGLIAILSGYEIFALPFLVLSFYSKEDGAAFSLTFGAVSFIIGGMWWIWICPPLLLLIWKYDRIKRMSTDYMTGAEKMRNGGLPGALPQPQHGVTNFVENLLRYPLWTFGLGQAPYHGSGIPTSSIFRMLLAAGFLISLLSAAATIPSFQIPVALILIGPWILYILFQTADILMEYRNYHSGVGIALLLGLLPISIGWVLALFLACRTYQLARCCANPNLWWEKCLKSGAGEKSRAWQEWASEHRQAKRLEEARYGYRKALNLNPDLCPARQNLAWLNVQQGFLEKGLEEINIAVERTPLQSGAWLDKGLISEKNSLLNDALTAYKSCVELDPNSEEGWNRRGIVAFSQRKYSEAIFSWLKVRELKPKIGDYIWNLSWALKMSGDKEGSAKLMRLLPKEIPMTDNMIHPPEAKTRIGV